MEAPRGASRRRAGVDSASTTPTCNRRSPRSTGGNAPATRFVSRSSRASFPDAVAFVVQVGFLAEAANHHPDVDIRWRTVHLALTTHDAGGLTALDVELARRIDAIA